MQLRPEPRGVRWAATAAVICAAMFAAAGCTPSRWRVSKEPDPVPAVPPSQAFLDARTTLLQAAQDTDPVVRANAIEAMSATLGDDAGEVYLQGLRDEYPVVRAAAAMVIGDLKYAPALPALRRISRTDPADPNATERDKMVVCPVIYALHRLGDDSRTQFLADLLFDPEPDVRKQAALAMGKMGDASAMHPLNTALANERELGVQIQLTESLAMLGDTRSANVLEAYTKGYWLDLRLAAIKALGRTMSERAIRVLTELTDDRVPTRVRVTAGGYLAGMGRPAPDMRGLTIRALRQPVAVLRESSKAHRRAADSDHVSLRTLAAEALGRYKDPSLVNELHPYLTAAEGAVRVAAAASILKLLKDYAPPAMPAHGLPAVAPVAPAPSAVPVEPAPVTPPTPVEPAPVTPPMPVEPAPVAPPETGPADIDPGSLLQGAEEPVAPPRLKTSGGKD